jgi:hypothetical protein
MILSQLFQIAPREIPYGSILNTQYSILNIQYSILNSQFSHLIMKHRAIPQPQSSQKINLRDYEIYSYGSYYKNRCLRNLNQEAFLPRDAIARERGYLIKTVSSGLVIYGFMANGKSWLKALLDIIKVIFESSRSNTTPRTWHQHVVPYEGDWAVRREGNKRITSKHRKQSTAITKAKRLAKKHKADVIIHREDGTIRERIGSD